MTGTAAASLQPQQIHCKQVLNGQMPCDWGEPLGKSQLVMKKKSNALISEELL